MGRVRTKEIKSIANELVKKNPEKFTEKYEENKKTLKEMNIIEQKKATNKISGYISRIQRKNARKNKRR